MGTSTAVQRAGRAVVVRKGLKPGAWQSPGKAATASVRELGSEHLRKLGASASRMIPHDSEDSPGRAPMHRHPHPPDLYCGPQRTPTRTPRSRGLHAVFRIPQAGSLPPRAACHHPRPVVLFWGRGMGRRPWSWLGLSLWLHWAKQHRSKTPERAAGRTVPEEFLEAPGSCRDQHLHFLLPHL